MEITSSGLYLCVHTRPITVPPQCSQFTPSNPDLQADDMMTWLVIVNCLYTRRSDDLSCRRHGYALRRRRCRLRVVWQNEVSARRLVKIEESLIVVLSPVW
jgi:hypothetical protein